MANSFMNRIGWHFALGAVATELAISGNLLTNLGIFYISDGGSILEKVHPGSYLAIASGLFTAIARPARGHGRHFDWRIAVFLAGIAFCAFYAVASTGIGSVVVFIDTFFSAGMLALSLCSRGENARRQLRCLVQCFLAANACIALCEYLLQSHFVPSTIDIDTGEAEFRPTALYDHALTAAAVTMLGLWLAPSAQGPLRWSYLMLLAAALIAFGERTPIAVAIIAVLGCLARRLGRKILERNVSSRQLAVVVLTSISIFTVAMVMSFYLNASTRLSEHLYWDNSAQVRLSQFDILGLLDPRELLFGCPRADLLALIEPLRLSTRVAVIENFWLFTFMTLGLFVFPVFVLSLLILLRWLWRVSSMQGHIMIVLFMIVASASNSLGRKSTLLVTLVACVVSSTVRAGGAGQAPVDRQC